MYPDAYDELSRSDNSNGDSDDDLANATPLQRLAAAYRSSTRNNGSGSKRLDIHESESKENTRGFASTQTTRVIRVGRREEHRPHDSTGRFVSQRDGITVSQTQTTLRSDISPSKGLNVSLVASLDSTAHKRDVANSLLAPRRNNRGLEPTNDAAGQVGLSKPSNRRRAAQVGKQSAATGLGREVVANVAIQQLKVVSLKERVKELANDKHALAKKLREQEARKEEMARKEKEMREREVRFLEEMKRKEQEMMEREDLLLREMREKEKRWDAERKVMEEKLSVLQASLTFGVCEL
ncbi:hypothetical protein BXZ70DRAFT_938751 [Cristinia sonorae]|uniref:Uncharacterized protein n=1 Tax=Cristinia sonorae TaxID=1940300 RepID=A0A8K0XQ35_9AGAR|nr:hypothetical protein BXZ70DRAFT_938751 [Cristinia sonorae]